VTLTTNATIASGNAAQPTIAILSPSVDWLFAMGGRSNGLRLSCGAVFWFSQMEDYHSKTAPTASGAC